MKRLLLLMGMYSVMTLIIAQVPQAFKYQAVVRDKAGQVLSNQNVTVRVSILQSAVDGPEVYREIHAVTTSELGLVNIEVGHGKALTGSLPSIDWSTGSHFLRVEMDQEGGTDFELMGVSQLLSVPYALYAEKSGNGEREADLDWEVIGNDVVTGHGGSYPIGNVGIGNNVPGTLLYVAKNTGEPTITIRNLGGGGGATYSMVDDLSGANWKFKATTFGGFKIRDQANALDVLTMEPNSAANMLYIKTGGNLGIGTSTPNGAALMHLHSTNKGFLPPQMNSLQMYAISNPPAGLTVYNTTESSLCWFDGINWNKVCGSCIPAPTQANAGPDQYIASGTSATLAANTPTSGTGLWAIDSGTGGTIAEPTSPTSEFQGEEGMQYTLSWTITTVCGSTVDNVLINFAGCGPYMIDSRDGKTYATILIGTQCWMAENLNVGTKINSTQGGYQQGDNETIEKYCYNNDEANCDIYGGLYEWPEAMQYVITEGAQGICPDGWHIATDNEWKVLEGTVDSQYPVGDPEWDGTGWRGLDAGGNLKELGTTHWNSPNTGATNSSGFSGLPGGYRSSTNGGFGSLGSYGYFWSSSQSDAYYAWRRYLGYDRAYVYRNSNSKETGFSVRCLKD